MYPVQIPGNTFADQYNRAYLQSLTPDVFYGLWATSGSFGIPMTGTPMDAAQRIQAAYALAGKGAKVTLADMTARAPYDVMRDYITDGYKVFGYLLEGTADWAMSPPGQSLPGLPAYDPTGHTGIVAFTPLPAPYSGPVVEPTKYVGLRANNDNGGEYNGINGAETKFVVGEATVQDGIQYVFIGGNPCWQYVGRA